jgi:hypothetical protein
MHLTFAPPEGLIRLTRNDCAQFLRYAQSRISSRHRVQIASHLDPLLAYDTLRRPLTGRSCNRRQTVPIKDIADVATSLTLVVTALAFVYTLWEHNSRESRREIQEWQKVVVYGIIENGTTVFDEIIVRYVVAAQQFSDLSIPSDTIQD